MGNPEIRRKHTRPIPYGEFGGPFFDPALIELMSRGGKRLVDLFGFLSAYGLNIKPEGRGPVTLLLKETLGKHNLQGILLQDDGKKTTSFHSKNIRAIETALSEARFDIIPYFAYGVENYNLLDEWRTRTVRSGS